MPSKRLNVPLSGARPSPKEPPLSIAGVNPLRVPPSAAAVAIAAVSHLTDSHPPQTTPLRAPLRSALANHCPALAPLVLTRRSLRLPPRAAALRPSRCEATPLRPPLRSGLANQASAACLLASAPRAIERGHTCGVALAPARHARLRSLFVPLVHRVLASRARAEISSPLPFEGALRPQAICRGHYPRA